MKEFTEAYNVLHGHCTKSYDEKSVIRQFTEVLDKIESKKIKIEDEDIYWQSMREILSHWSLKHYHVVANQKELNGVIPAYEKQVDEKQKELEVYKDWVNNLQKQNEERMKDTEVYKDWVNNLQKQNEERMKEVEVYKDWVGNLQKQIEDMKG